MSENKQNVTEKIKLLLKEIEESNNENYTRLLDEICGIVESEHFELFRNELTEENYRRRMVAATILGRKRDDKSNDALLKLLDDPVGDVREAAVTAVTNIGRQGTAAKLMELVGDPKPKVRKTVLDSLAELNYNLLEVILIRAMNDVDRDVRKTAIKHLRKFGTPKCGGCALRALLDNDYEMQMYAEQVLDRILHHFTDANYVLINEGLSLRERRLIITYLESRYLQVVYPRLYEALHSGGPIEIPTMPDQKDIDGLSKYGRVLNYPEEFDRLLTPYEREDIVDQVVEDYIRGTAQSTLFVGESGVGKTAIIHGIARKLIQLHSDKKLKTIADKWYVLETSTSELITETRYLGEWETKLKKMIEIIECTNGHVIIYLTNPNDLLGAGTHSNSEENFADFFRPYLLRGDILMISETTQEELNKGLACEPGFLRLFKQIHIGAMTIPETTDALMSKVEKNDFEMIRRMVNKKRELPITPSKEELPPNMNMLTPAQAQLKKTRRRPYKSVEVEANKLVIDSVIHLAKSFIPSTVMPGAAADLLEDVVDFKMGEYEAELRKKSPEEQTEKLGEIEVKITLNFDDITRTLSKKSGLPLNLIDPTRTLDLEEARKFFSDRLVGQIEPIGEMLNRLAMIKAGLNNPGRPLGVYFLVGPTGVGKTYFAKLVAEYLFGDPERLVRLDLSEYQTPFAIDKIIGAGGPIRHNPNSGGILTTAIRNQPYSIILLDEFEKAHPDIFSLFLQAFDDARITDGNGKTLDLKQTLIIITSNLGAVRETSSVIGFGEESQEEMRDRIIKKMRKVFAPEFINRLDKVIPFDSLNKKSIDALIDIEINKMLERRGFSTYGYKMVLELDAREWLEKHGFSKDYGARHLLRTIEQNILPATARLIINQEQKDPGTIISVRCRKEGDPDYGSALHAEWIEVIHPDDKNDEHENTGSKELSLRKEREVKQELNPTNLEPPAL